MVARKVSPGCSATGRGVGGPARRRSGGIGPMGWIRKILRVGRVVEAAAAAPDPVGETACGSARFDCRFGTSTRVRATGARWRSRARSARCMTPNGSGRGWWLRPRHADALLVTGVVTRNMVEPLRNTVRRDAAASGGHRVRGLRPEPGGVQGCVRRGRRGGRGGARRRGNPGMPTDAGRDHRGLAIGDRQVTAGPWRPAAAHTPKCCPITISGPLWQAC